MDSQTPPEPLPPVVSPTHPPARRRRWVGSLLALLLLVALGGGAWYLVQRSKSPAPGAGGPGAGAGRPGGGGPGGRAGGGGPASSTVGTAVARQADIPVQLEALGTVTPLANVTVQPQVSGVLTAVLFKEGQMVKKGDVLATIDPQPFENALAQAAGARQRDEAQLAAARVTLQRYQTLLGQDSIARQDVDTQAALVKQLEGTVAIDRANENTAKLNLAWSRITAPVSGRIGLRPVDAGNYISTGSTGGVATITQIAPIDVEFAIPQDRVPEVQERLGQGATLATTAFDRTRTRRLADGSFSTLDNMVDTQTGTVKAKARFTNADGALFPNQFVNLRLLLRTVSSAVVVPVTALRHGPNGDYVYVVTAENTASQRPVTRGESSVDFASITKGLQPGETVVTEGGDRLKDGARVQTTVDRPAGAASGAAAPGGRRGGRRQEGAGGAQGGGARPAEAAAPASPSQAPAAPAAGTAALAAAPAAATPAPAATPAKLPTAEQRQRMLDAAKDDPEQLERRKRFLEALDRGDPAALERWQRMAERGGERGGEGRRSP
ncbi:efflux RND transporter periplasmic adaptor subunit [Variovorax boronicumulans]|uniref:efflux RND transporter periplasmic adaptor subunit n=1 Tax=Variovorax boronicumulans TaxID=436515 RepID=UPI0012E4CCF9|nr:efflux RND transporter periplasmic adaptor subunit [Variovorax boronicumulans]GER15317.1 efflux RND transporter periplasmic adaptor subunit [Variovorax boronicumulans]